MSRRQIVALAAAGSLLIAGVGIWNFILPSSFSDYLMDHLFGEAPSAASLTPAQGDLLEALVNVDAGATGHPISPYIYGIAGAGPDEVRQLGATLNRWGGNPSSRYNWVNGHAWNAGRDWEFRNVDYWNPTGSAADQFIIDSFSGGAVPLLTVPTIGWVARNDDKQVRSLGVPSHGDAALSPGSSAIAGYDPAPNRRLTSVPSFATQSQAVIQGPTGDAIFQDMWIHHLVSQFPNPSAVGLLAMDNEPDLWSETHTDVHPVQMGYNDMLRTFEDYAVAVRAQAPNARILGPDVSGWTSYWYSALDRGPDNFRTHADRTAHGGQPFLAWWLSEVAKQDRLRGSRTLDLLDVHYYPQAYRLDSAVSDPATQELRIRSTRSLYDPNYRDESWINDIVMLIPRLKKWIAENYPGTGLAITEYRWGGEQDASGAVALATVLGIFGREGVDVASYWTSPKADSPAGAAFRLYSNYDGRGARFGDISIPVTSNRSDVVVFAAKSSKTGEVDVMVVNQSLQRDATVRLSLHGFTPGATELYQVLAGSGDITKGRPVLSSSVKFPAASVNLIRLLP